MKTDFLGVQVEMITCEGLIDKVVEFAFSAKHRMITYFNADCSNIAFQDTDYRRILNSLDIVYADGMSVVWGSRFLGRGVPERVNILDFSEKIFNRLAAEKIKAYFLGSSEKIVYGVVEKLKTKFPSINIAGFHHGYFTALEEENIIAEINRLKPDILFVCMGVPKQEKWAFEHLKNLEVGLCWVTGSGMFDNFSGFKSSAPRWMGKVGLEWFYRLASEPRRLWKRYLIGNPFFIYRLMKYKIRGLSSGRTPEASVRSD
ncbi:MAG: WecB/TagA/CpsF family glycosyltransferase [Candidatus Omnitrophica bacterium]|jgi:N-acetylglucosaminyldiphosphoundecaprenol N-acetyl-beta-D-mannosaminyltransferase|nr:WecB/TagA/CpsF family glycosyltransferase [Candidatus Omnitrophota bacterium]MDD3274574.1 WecB/TagA/CpsF family glycosyltransferase [Candidatus Omnitrophota bacterium]MDD5078211.1 WecB/TagA/CpsF family glycosyltransferase [Candidatus Omnitrophota bacterium]MDD5724734.1 WecB/TagA/CpsF family glycosyltransferase [Candidatus Omnitrophota bacterium]